MDQRLTVFCIIWFSLIGYAVVSAVLHAWLKGCDEQDKDITTGDE